MNPNMRKVLLDAPSLMVNGRVRYGQLAQCIALRPVAEGYNGNACTVRRSTDNTSQDVGFLGTELDSFSLMNFVGSENLLLRSEEMDNASWVKSGLTITSNAAIAPDGTLTADLLSNTTTESIYQQTTLPAASGSVYTYSVYVKQASLDWIRFTVFESANSANQLTLWFNPSTGTLGTVSAGGTATLVTGNVVAAANGFYRIYLTGSFVASLINFQTNVVTSDGSSATANNSARYQWGAQVNLGTLQDYSRTVASSRLGSQNMLVRSEEMDNVNWLKTDTTITANAIAAPDGLTTADLLTEGVAGTGQILQTVTVEPQKAYTASLYLKYGNHDWIRIQFYETNTSNAARVWVNLTTGALGTSISSGTGVTNLGTTITNVGNGWYRVTISATFTNPSAALYVISVTANNSFTRVNNGTRYQWGAQVNQGSVAAAYQKTVATTTEWGANQNLVTYSEGVVSTLAASSGVTDAGTSITGYAASVQFGDNSLLRILYKSYTPKSGATYTISVIVQMDDNSPPVVGLSNSSGDFCLVSSSSVTTGTPVVTSLGGNVYRVSSSFVTPHTLSDWGVVKYTTQSSKGFRITAMQVNEGSVAQSYIRTLDKAIDVGNGYLTKIYDQSGNARDMSQATAANQPRIVFHGTGEKINGKAAFTTDGASQQLTSTAFDLKQPYTRCGALQFTTIPSVAKGIFSDVATNGAILRVTATGLLRMTTGTTVDLYLKTGIAAGDKAVTVEVYNSTATMGSYNRNVVATPVSSKLPDIPITQTRIGQDAGGYANVVVGEMIIFPQALSHSDRQTWEATAKQYWSTP
jgi:hypothetical protein